jgi:hypothetical protein
LLNQLTAVVLLFLAVVGCKQLQSLGSPTVLKSHDGKFQLTVPAGWRENPALNEQADIKAAFPSEEMYVIVITEPKADFTSEMTLDEFTKITRDSMLSNLGSSEGTSPSLISVNGNSGEQYELQGSVKNVKLAYVVTTVETPAHYHQVITWTLGSRLDKNRATLQKVIATFRPS